MECKVHLKIAKKKSAYSATAIVKGETGKSYANIEMGMACMESNNF